MSEQDDGRRRLLIYCDSPTAPTGLARMTRAAIEQFKDEYEVAVMGWGYGNQHHDYPVHIYSIFKGDPNGTRHFLNMAEDWNPDLILCMGDPWDFPHVPGAVAVLRAKLGKYIPWYYLALIDGHPLQKSWTSVFMDPDGVAVTSTYGKKAIKELVPALDPPVIRLGVDSEFWKVASEHRLSIGAGGKDQTISRKNTFVMFWAGVNSNRKNLEGLLRAAAPILKSHEDSYLLVHVAYEDVTGCSLFDVAERMAIPAAQFAVNIGPADRRGIDEGRLRQYYAISTVVACTSIGEGNWLPGYEAQACGCVTIGTDFSAIKETIGSRGILVPTVYEGYIGQYNLMRAWVDIRAFTSELEGLYDDWKNNNSLRIKEMVARGRKWAERHPWTKFSGALAKLISTEREATKRPANARTWVKDKVQLFREDIGFCCPTFKQNCGIAQYSESLVNALHGNGLHVRTYATKKPDQLATAAVGEKLSLMHLQHEQSFYDRTRLQSTYYELAEHGIASVTTMHTATRDDFLNRPVIEGSSAVLVHSAAQKKMLLEIVPDAKNIHIMPMGAPFPQLRSQKRLRAMQGYHKDDFVIASHGFLREQKGYDVLLNTLVRMEASVKLLIFASAHEFGDPAYDERFMQTVEEMGLSDRVTLVRERLNTKSEICNLLSTADVCALAYRDPPDYCGVSSAAKDCAATGRPLILTDSLAFSDFGPDDAMFVPQNDHEPVIEAINRLRGDKELYDMMAHAARQYAWEHRWGHIGELHVKLYEDILEGAR